MIGWGHRRKPRTLQSGQTVFGLRFVPETSRRSISFLQNYDFEQVNTIFRAENGDIGTYVHTMLLQKDEHRHRYRHENLDWGRWGVSCYNTALAFISLSRKQDCFCGGVRAVLQSLTFQPQPLPILFYLHGLQINRMLPVLTVIAQVMERYPWSQK